MDALDQGRLSVPAWVENHAEIPVLMIWHREKWCTPSLKAFMDITAAQMEKQLNAYPGR